jgi:hypothetical protein
MTLVRITVEGQVLTAQLADTPPAAAPPSGRTTLAPYSGAWRGLQDKWGPERIACVAGDIRDEATSLPLVQTRCLPRSTQVCPWAQSVSAPVRDGRPGVRRTHGEAVICADMVCETRQGRVSAAPS